MKIDKAIEESNGQIRNLSEFGTKAVKFYLDYIENSQAVKELMLEAVVALAQKTDVNTDEIDRIREILENTNMYPTKPLSGRSIEDHPLIEARASLSQPQLFT